MVPFFYPQEKEKEKIMWMMYYKLVVLHWEKQKVRETEENQTLSSKLETVRHTYTMWKLRSRWP